MIQNEKERKIKLNKLKKGEVGWVMFNDIDALEKKYREIVDIIFEEIPRDFNDKTRAEQMNSMTKIMQGIERCLDLKMKLMGLDGKNQTILHDICGKDQANKNNSNKKLDADDIIINAEQLSENTVRELKNIIEKNEC